MDNDENVWKTFGVHPHHANDFDMITYMALNALLTKSKRVVALGEIGLDYSSKNSVSRDIQIRTFDLQLRMAMDLKLPICLHLRESDEDGLATLKDVGLPSGYPIHLHCFNGTWEKCQIWLDKYPNLRVGFTPMITFKRATHLHDVIKRIPLNRILLETDSPYFVPRQLSESERTIDFSHPGLIIHAAAQVAKLKKVTIETVIKAHKRSLFDVYKIPPVVGFTIEAYEYTCREEEEELDRIIAGID